MHLNAALAKTVSLSFVALAIWHLWMALSPEVSAVAAVPSVAGRPLSVPSTKSFVGVAVILLMFAAFVAATGGVIQVELRARHQSWPSFALALGLLARATGESGLANHRFSMPAKSPPVRLTRTDARPDSLLFTANSDARLP